MKKRVFFIVFLVLVMVSSLFFSLAAFADTDTVEKGGSLTDLTAKDNGYYYTNKTFTYTKNADATGVLYWTFSYSDFNQDVAGGLDDVRDYVLGSSVLTTAIKPDDTTTPALTDEGEIEFDASSEEFFVIVDYYEDEETPANVTYSNAIVVCVDLTAPVVDRAKLLAWLTDPDNETGFENSWISGKDDWEFPVEWAYDVDLGIVVEAPAKIEVEEKDDEGEATGTMLNRHAEDLLIVYMQYLPPSGYYDDEWDDCEGDTTFDLDVVGIWRLRYVVKDAAGNVAVMTDANGDAIDKDGAVAQNDEDKLQYVLEIQRNVRDTTPPNIKYTTTQKKVTTTGTVAGKTYSIPSSPTVTDEMSSTTTTYKVYKIVNGVEVVIYDSDTKKVTEGYEDFIAVGGILTPGLDEVTGTKADDSTDWLYFVIHTATDAYGNSATTENERLNIKVTQPEVSAYEVWKIVLVCVACVSAAGIIVLIFIKPKEPIAPQRGEAEAKNK